MDLVIVLRRHVCTRVSGRGRRAIGGGRTDDCVDEAKHESLGGPVDDEVAGNIIVVKRDLVLVGEGEMHA